MHSRLARRRSIGVSRIAAALLSLAAGVVAAVPVGAATSGPPLACEVTRDQGWGEFYFTNLGTAPVPERAVIDWRTSSGKSGRLTLDQQIDPGKRRYMPAIFIYEFGVDVGATCAAVVVSRPPTLGEQLRIQPQSALTTLLAKPGASGALLVQPCKYCDSQALMTAQAGAAPATSPPAAVLLAPKAATGEQSAALPATSRFDPPKAPGGQRLLACATLDGAVCGQPVADQFCRQQGYGRAGGYDTERRKGPAVTLAGEACATKKCKVFDLIVCVP